MRKGALLAALLLVAVAAVLFWPRAPVPARPTPGPAAAADPAVPAAKAADPAPSAVPDARHDVTPPLERWTPAADAFLLRARQDPELTVVLAEVLERGNRFRQLFGDQESQAVRLRLLADAAAHRIRKYQELKVVLTPAASLARYGVATPFDALEVGQVREVVLGVQSERWSWLVFAGPPQESPADPLLAKVPGSLVRFLGREGCAVFRGRIRELERKQVPQNERVGLPTEVEHLQVEVLEWAENPHGLAAGSVVALSNVPPMLPIEDPDRLPLGVAAVGAEYWIASEGSGAFAFLRAAVPVH